MRNRKQMQCLNCGAEWLAEPAPSGTSDGSSLPQTCPVCQFVISSGTAQRQFHPLSSSDLAARLGALVVEARASGLDLDKIIHTLRDELEFVAELAHNGRQLCVQIVDIGPQEAALHSLLNHDPDAILQRRAVGQGL